MFTRVLKHEFSAMFRDKMYLFLMSYPIIMAIVAYFLMPYLNEQGAGIATHIVTLFFILMNGFMFGAITGFTLLDDQDDNVLLSLRITPINVNHYIFVKLAISYLLGILSTLLIIITSGFIEIVDPFNLVFILLLAPLHGPIVALLVNAFSNNKVEGFVIMKASGIILLAPVAVLFLTDWKELFLTILPGFWPARLIAMELLPMEYFFSETWIYFILGLIINMIVIYLLYLKYRKRIHI
ncbi:MAG TPA: ABC transporter permease [Acholeplasmataceae bacterium]|nr:ABC transporter permease [Acholeplasmataceae bacterium]